MDHDLAFYIAIIVLVVAPLAAVADYLLDERLLRRKRRCRMCYLLENAVAIVVFFGIRSLLSFETLQMISSNIETIILQLSCFKALILMFVMALGHGASQVFSVSNALSVVLRTATIGIAGNIFVFLMVIFL